MISAQTVYTTEDRKRAVPEGSKDAKFLLVRAGHEIEPKQFEKYEGAAELIEGGKADEETNLESMKLHELANLANERDIEVTRADGGNGAPLKSDYIAALKKGS